VDLNRAGAALMELVTAPDLRSGKEAVVFIKKLAAILRAVDASDAIMDDASF
jgi:aspartyl-tRNA(Asn)/glutamyl-tRNA(Gln) amidotransferase subunit B